MPGDGEPTKKAAQEASAGEAAAEQKKEAPGASEAGATGEKEAVGTTSASEAGKKQEAGLVSPAVVLERFRTYGGPRTAEALLALFDNSDMKGIRQAPPVALADGITRVTVFVTLPAGESDAPNFAFRGAKYLSLKMAGENSWTVEVLPDKGAMSAAVKVLRRGVLVEVPLTIAPPLPAGVRFGSGETLTEADFSAFLKDAGTAKEPRYDLNGDGKRDYLDDYIFTANYLVKRDSRKKATVKEQK